MIGVPGTTADGVECGAGRKNGGRVCPAAGIHCANGLARQNE